MGSLLCCQFPKHYTLDVVLAYSSGFANRVLSGFQDIEAEAEAAGEEYFESRMNREASEDDGVDEGAVADDAQEYGLSLYADLEFVRQQVTGLAIAGLYHLWERLVKKFIETSFLVVVKSPVNLEKVRSANFKDVVGWLRDHFGWDIEAEGFFADLDQLHLVANVVKHGDGPSCEELLTKAPELFRDVSYLWGNDLSGYEPRRADDLSLEREHFVKFTRSVVQFIKCFPTGERQPVASTR